MVVVAYVIIESPQVPWLGLGLWTWAWQLNIIPSRLCQSDEVGYWMYGGKVVLDRDNLKSPGRCQGGSRERCRARSQDDVSLDQSALRVHLLSANQEPGFTCCPNQPAKNSDLLIRCQSWNKCWQWNYNISASLVPVKPSDFSECWPRSDHIKMIKTINTLIIMRQFAGHK